MKSLTPSDRKLLETHKQRIALAALGSCLVIGESLKVIRDKKLFKSEANSFEAFVNDNYGISRQHAYRLISAYEDAEKTPEAAQLTEKQLRAIRAIPEEKRDRVLSQIEEAEGGMSAAAITQAAADLSCPEVPDEQPDDSPNEPQQESPVPEQKKEKPAPSRIDKAKLIRAKAIATIQESVRRVGDYGDLVPHPLEDPLKKRLQSVVEDLKTKWEVR